MGEETAIIPPAIAGLGLVGGALCLDFTNSVSGRLDGVVGEHLHSYAELVAWAHHAGALTADEARRLLAAGQRRQPAAAAAVYAQAIALREASYRLFVALAATAPAPSADLGVINAALAAALAHLQLAPAAPGFAWAWGGDPDTLDRVLWPLARSVGDLLTSDHLDRVRQCAGDDCGWLFLDLSRNHSRRWCDMNDCGNRAKARRHYQRRRSPALDAAG